MGYSTDFEGSFELDRPLAPEHKAYLEAFADKRRMVRDVTKAADMPDPIRVAADLPIGPAGAYFVGGTGMAGQDRDASVIDYNNSPPDQPGLWCQWVPSKDGTEVVWDGGEKFYDYVAWLEYLVAHFLKPWGYSITGEVTWIGEDDDDRGRIFAEDNVITVKRARLVYE